MKISELMEKLGELQGEHGDIDVIYTNGLSIEEIQEVQFDKYWTVTTQNNEPCAVLR